MMVFRTDGKALGANLVNIYTLPWPFLSVLFRYFEIVLNIRNTSDKLNLFLLSVTFYTHPNAHSTCDGMA